MFSNEYYLMLNAEYSLNTFYLFVTHRILLDDIWKEVFMIIHNSLDILLFLTHVPILDNISVLLYQN